ncbi:MAG TPA: DUF4845 domain-containing protein [Steroidobacteraceae bacterium]|nr:DUF4845 domain-containing protein [Steroidobacteraceae bacterium]
MRQRQKGVTFIGWLFLLAPLAVLVYCGIRLTPVYLNYFAVTKSMNQVASEYKGAEGAVNVTEVHNALQRRWDVDSINYPEVKTITVAREGEKWMLEANYEDEVKVFSGISLLVHFDKKVAVQ